MTETQLSKQLGLKKVAVGYHLHLLSEAELIRIEKVEAEELGILAILTPIVVGLLLHEEALGGFLAGTILTGQLLAVFMATSGAAWDNAKKITEEGLYGGKGSEP